jgi:hypothetical protein
VIEFKIISYFEEMHRIAMNEEETAVSVLPHPP